MTKLFFNYTLLIWSDQWQTHKIKFKILNFSDKQNSIYQRKITIYKQATSLVSNRSVSWLNIWVKYRFQWYQENCMNKSTKPSTKINEFIQKMVAMKHTESPLIVCWTRISTWNHKYFLSCYRKRINASSMDNHQTNHMSLWAYPLMWLWFGLHLRNVAWHKRQHFHKMKIFNELKPGFEMHVCFELVRSQCNFLW